MAIDDNNRLVKLFSDEEQKITLWYDKFERKLFVEDTNDLVKYLSDGSKYVPEKIPEKTEVLYSVAINGVLSIKFSQAVDRRTLNTLTVNDLTSIKNGAAGGDSYIKIVDFVEDETLVLMTFQNTDTLMIQGLVTDKLKNGLTVNNIVAWPVIYLTFNEPGEIANYWKLNKQRLTSINTIDITEKDFNFEYTGDSDTTSEYNWLTEQWGTFYYDPTVDKSYNFDAGFFPTTLSTELVDRWALCYLREVPSGFNGEKEGPFWYVTQFENREDPKTGASSTQITGFKPDITSYFEIEELQDYYDAAAEVFGDYTSAAKYYETEGYQFYSYIYFKNGSWYTGEKGKQIESGIYLVITKQEEVLMISFKDYVISEILSYQDYTKW
jgi:hypothetical protein